MNTRPLIITNEQLLAIAGLPDWLFRFSLWLGSLLFRLPADAKVESAGPTTGTERGKVDGVFARISR